MSERFSFTQDGREHLLGTTPEDNASSSSDCLELRDKWRFRDRWGATLASPQLQELCRRLCHRKGFDHFYEFVSRLCHVKVEPIAREVDNAESIY